MLAIRILIRSPKTIRGERILRDGVRGVIRLSTPEAVHLSAPIEQALLRENLADIINIARTVRAKVSTGESGRLRLAS